MRSSHKRQVASSAGHNYEHPRAAAAQRYLAYGVPLANMFRTDRGDDESSPNEPDQEWAHGRINGHSDPTGDDDVDIVVTPTGTITVQYRSP